MFSRTYQCILKSSFYLLVFCFVLFLSSCNAPYNAPSKSFVHRSEEPICDINDFSVVIDTCIKMDELKDFISVENSRKIQSYMSSAMKSYLENIGYNIGSQEAPFVGGFKASSETETVQAKKKGKKIKASPPFFIEENVAGDEEYQQSLQRVIQTVHTVFQNLEENPIERFAKNKTLQDDLQLIKEKMNNRYLMVVIANGTNVPGLTSFSQAMVTGMTTGILTGGLVTVAVCDVTFIDTFAAVIDLEQSDMLWSNYIRLKEGSIFKENYYAKWNKKSETYDGWAKQVFFHVPIKPNKLIDSVKNNEKNLIKWMVLTGTDLDRGDESQMTALHWSVKDNCYGTVKLLLKQKADINCQDNEGNTPLHYAVSNNRYKIAKYLLKKKADVHIKNNQGDYPLDIATAKQSKKFIKLLKKYELN